VEHPTELRGDLDGVLGLADIAAVLLRLPQAGERTLIDYAKVIAPVVQDKGVALILDSHPDIVAQAGADGAHLTGIEAFIAALDNLKPQRIAGAGGLRSRHDAMIAAERGADYVMFGEANGGRPQFAAILERVVWWAELFELPCVGYAENLDEIAPLVSAGADFVALGAFALSDPNGASAIIQAAAELLSAAEPMK